MGLILSLLSRVFRRGTVAPENVLVEHGPSFAQQHAEAMRREAMRRPATGRWATGYGHDREQSPGAALLDRLERMSGRVTNWQG